MPGMDDRGIAVQLVPIGVAAGLSVYERLARLTTVRFFSPMEEKYVKNSESARALYPVNSVSGGTADRTNSGNPLSASGDWRGMGVRNHPGYSRSRDIQRNDYFYRPER